MVLSKLASRVEFASFLFTHKLKRAKNDFIPGPKKGGVVKGYFRVAAKSKSKEFLWDLNDCKIAEF